MQLRTDLAKQLDLIGVASRTLYVNAALAPGSKAALQLQLSKITGLTVEVTPTLSPKGVAALKTQLGIIPIEVQLASGQARKIQSEVASASAVANVGGAAAGGTATRGSVDILSQEARIQAAVENQTKARVHLNEVLALTDASLDKVTLAEQRLLTTTLALTAETEKLALIRQTSTQAAVNAETAAAVAAAEKELAVQKERIAVADASIASTARLNAVEVARVAAIKATRDATIQGKDAQDVDTAAKQASIAVGERLVAMQAQETAATRAGDVAQAESIALTRQETGELLIQIEARRAMSQLNLRLGAAPAAIENLTTSKGALELEKQLLAEITTLEEIRTAALNSGTIATANNAAGTVRRVETLAAEAAQAAKTLATQEALLVTQERVAAFDTRIAAATNASLSLASQRSRLVGIEISLAAAIDAATVATTASTAADLEALLPIQARTAALIADRDAIIANQAAAAKSAVTLSQVQRGAIGTGAGFLGLRGAILSASSGFLAATIAVTAFAKIIGTAAALQQSLNVFASVAEASSEEMAAVSDTARSLGADLSLPATSANDAAEAMTELARAGLTVQDSMDAARGVLQLAAAAQISVKDAATIAATELNAFGLSGDQATRVADLLAGAAKSAQGEITDFALAFQQVAAVANQVELPIETTTAILTQFAKAGLRGSDAGTSLRTMLLRLVPTTKAAAEAQSELGIEINRNLPIGKQYLDLVGQYTRALEKLDPIAQQESLTKIFGQDAIRGATVQFGSGTRALVEIEAAISKSGIAAEQAAARQKGLTGAVDGLKSEIETFAASIGSVLLPSLEAVTRDLAGIVKTADEAINVLKELGNVGIGGATASNLLSQLAGPLATIGLAAGAGLGGKKLLDLRNERNAKKLAAVEEIRLAESVAAANVLAFSTTTTAARRMQTEVSASTKRMGLDQIIAAEAAAAANIKAAALSESAWRRAAATIGAALRQSSQARSLAAGAALTVGGSLAAQSGNQDIAAAGNIVSAAGAGFIAGSLIPLPGAGLVTAGAFASLALLQESQRRTKERQTKLAEQWQAMTPEEQRAYIRERFPNEAPEDPGSEIEAMIARTGVKPSTAGESFAALQKAGIPVRAPISTAAPETTSAEEFIESVGGLNAEDQKALDAAKKLTADRVKFEAEFAKAIFHPLDVISGEIRSPSGLIDDAIEATQEMTKGEAQLQVSIAQASGSVQGEIFALRDLAEVNQNRIDELNRLLNEEDPHKKFAALLRGEARAEAQAELDQANIDQAKINASIQELNRQRVAVTPLSLTLSGIAAGATPGLEDNVTQAEAVLAEANKDLAATRANRARLDPKTGLPGATQKDVDDAIIAQANARAGVVTANASLASKAESDAAKAKSDAKKAADAYIDMLDFTAEQAGRIGPAEDKLLAALKAQVDKAEKNTPEWVSAQKAYLSEIQKQQAALQSMADAARSLRDANSNFALTIAKTTPGTQDEKAILRKQIQDDKDDIAAIKKRIKDEHLKGAALLEAKQQIVAEQQDIFNKIQEIKGINAAGSFSPGDFFAAILSSFQSFGSNIQGDFSGILSPQDAIGAASARALGVAGRAAIVPQRGGAGGAAGPATVDVRTAPKQADNILAPLTNAVQKSETEQAKRDGAALAQLMIQTRLLAKIAGVPNPNAKGLTTGIRGARTTAANGVPTGLGLANRDQ